MPHPKETGGAITLVGLAERPTLRSDPYSEKRANIMRMSNPLLLIKRWGAVRRSGGGWLCVAALAANVAGAQPEGDTAKTLQDLLEKGHAAAAEQQASRLLESPRLESRADSINVLVATRVLIAAKLQQSKYDDPELDPAVETLLRMGRSIFGPRATVVADAHQYAGLIHRFRGDTDMAIEEFRNALRIIESDSLSSGTEAWRVRQNLGEIYFDSGRYSDAKREFELELVALRTFAPDTLDVGVALINLNEVRKAVGDTVGITEAYVRARRVFERNEGPESASAADALHREGAWRFACGDTAGAALALDRAIVILGRPGKLGLPLAESLIERARVHLAAGEADSSIAQATRARDICLEAVGPSDSRVGNCIMAIGDAERAAYRNEEALASYQKALAVYERSAPPDPPALNNCLRMLASQALDLARYPAALGYARRALRESPGVWGGRSTETAITRLAYAATLYASRQPDSARIQYETARDDIRANLGDSNPLLAEPILRLATLDRERGDLAQARAGAERALDLLERGAGSEDPRLSEVHHELGIVKRRLGDPQGARSELERALELAQKGGRESEAQAAILSSLALLDWSLEDEDAAMTRFLEALAITGRVRGPNHPRHAMVMRNLASLSNARGRFSEAKDLYERALTILEPALGREHPDVAATRLGLGNALRALGEGAGARAQYEMAIALHREALGTEAPALALDYHNLATLSLEGKDLPAAMTYAEEAERLSRQHFQLIVRGVSEREALYFAAERVRGADIVLTVAGRSGLRSDWEKAWDMVIRSRAVVLDEMAARRRFSATTQEPEVVALVDRLTRASNNLALLAVRGRGETEPLAEFKHHLAAARLEKEAAERALAARSTEFSRRLERESIGLREVLQALPPRSALVAWVQYDRLERAAAAGDRQDGGERFYAAFVVHPAAREVTLVPIGPATEVEALVSDWREQAGRNPNGDLPIEEAEEQCERAGLALRRSVWDPVSQGVRGADRVFLVPDGALCLVNFDAMPIDAGGYLMEKAPLFLTLDTERSLLDVSGIPAGGDGLLTVGAPEYSAVPSTPQKGSTRSAERGIPCGQFKALEFKPLTGTAFETEAIVQLWREDGEGEVYQLAGPEASEGRFRQMAGGRRVLHVATHGFFLGSECAGRRFKSGAVARDELTVGGLVAESPLLLSGLAFAGANLRAKAPSSSDDGILTAEEIASLDLRSVDLAVLSACGTGMGQVEAGEGVIGLRRAFRVAGVRSLIMSLWSVADDATARWMQELFRASLQGKRGAAEAVRDASLATLRERRRQGVTDHPFFWGAFIATVD